jgi:ribosomal protein L10
LRERFLCSRYVNIMKQPLVCFLQISNMNPTESLVIRQGFKKNGLMLEEVNSRLFKSQLLNSQYQHAIPLLNGPTCVIYPAIPEPSIPSPNTPLHCQVGKLSGGPSAASGDGVNLVEKIKQILVLSRKNKKLLVLGAKLERHLVDSVQLDWIGKNLKDKKALQGELLSVLSYPASSIRRVLSYTSGDLVRTLKAHQEHNLEKE